MAFITEALPRLNSLSRQVTATRYRRSLLLSFSMHIMISLFGMFSLGIPGWSDSIEEWGVDVSWRMAVAVILPTPTNGQVNGLASILEMIPFVGAIHYMKKLQ